jgi:hypothetical protein
MKECSMRLTALFPHLHALRLLHQNRTDGALTLVVTLIGQLARCRRCKG